VKPDPEPVKAMQQSAASAADLQKVAYLEKVQHAHYNKDFKANMEQLMSMGFLDFEKNLQLLQQHYNNLEPVLAKLIE